MSRLAANAGVWTAVYEAFANINFGAYDYNSVKSSLIDYIKLNFSETFNDFIETSELIVIIENFAYIAELCAYRIDISAHENFLSTAQRKESILRLAKFISYTASRPLPARGLVKITSVRTTENAVDSFGTSLTNLTVRWNDTNNTNWKDQFFTVINKALQQSVGFVSPSDRFQLQDVLFELYHMNNSTIQNGVLSYSVSLTNKTLPFELVPVAYDSTFNIVEQRPNNKATFTILYGQDGLGDSSETTGFFMFTKQGSLRRYTATFDGITPNQFFTIPSSNVNDIDIWVNNVDPSTGLTITSDPNTSTAKQTNDIYGEWQQVDTTHSQNITFNTSLYRNKFEVETLVNNEAKILFGDGEFSDIPNGTFDIWARTSADTDDIIPRNSIVDKQVNIPYIDSYGKNQTLSITFSLINALQNASAAETIEHIRRNAPAAYYAQNRMVSDEDYNTFMQQDSTILKLQSNNRTFAGDSKYITWHDARGGYENVKVFGTDAAIYFRDQQQIINTNVVDINALISSYITPILSTLGMFTQVTSRGTTASSYRTVFNSNETTMLINALTPPSTPILVDMYYNIDTFEWHSIKRDGAGPSLDPVTSAGWPSSYITTPLIQITQTNVLQTSYRIDYLSRDVICHSSNTNFWNINDSKTINYDTLGSSYDTITILRANVNNNRTSVLQQEIVCNILAQDTFLSGTVIGQTNYNSLAVITQDTNSDRLPDGLNVSSMDGLGDLINPKLEYTLASMSQGTVVITLPIYYVSGNNDVIIRDKLTGDIISTYWTESSDPIANTIELDVVQLQTIINSQDLNVADIIVEVNEYVYFSRETLDDPWVKVLTTTDNIKEYISDYDFGTNLKTRYQGRDSINFEWVHITPSYHLTDPSPSNIIDTYIITKGYYSALKGWVDSGSTAPAPSLPTPLDLRVAYSTLTSKKMFSDSIVHHPGKIKLLFGAKAATPLRAKFKVIKSVDRRLTDNQIKNIIVSTIRNFFDIQLWEFGETFYFTELAAAIHTALPTEINSVVLVPLLPQNFFGNMFEVTPATDEVFYCDVTSEDIEIVTSYTQANINIST